ncbi:MAG TPA: DUF3362 domain-containing protein [Candidatus Nanoarchaeia archaeon]|nr:DUF3362 domain-containing protein [Candidatus Nanoarchaeia archaeon]
MKQFLPTTLDEGKSYYSDFQSFDVIFVTGDPYYDHPLSGVAILSRLLDRKGYKVGIIAQPLEDNDYQVCGTPKYFFCITSGLLDSMLANYTPMLKQRENVLVPERALMVYTQKLKQLHKGVMTIIGGVEATIRRFTHFDYKENKLRRGILNDTKADLLLFGNAERSLLTLLERMQKLGVPITFQNIRQQIDLPSLEGVSYLIKKDEITKAMRNLPSYEECVADKDKFNLLTRIFYLLPEDAFTEACGLGIVRHNRPSHTLTEEEMDFIYNSPFTRELHPNTKNLAFNQEMVGNLESSVIIGRGCWGSCSFCVIPLVQGKEVARRSKDGILHEIETLYKNGMKKINDLTLPTLNMYGSRCSLYTEEQKMHSPIINKTITVFNKVKYCNQQCVGCKYRVLSDDLIPVLEGVEKLQQKYDGSLELRSALRHDIVLQQKELFRKVMLFTSRLKIAPEHISDHVLKQMNKADGNAFKEFLKEFQAVNKEQGTDKRLVPYFVAAHPGSTMRDMEVLRKFCKEEDIFINLTQVFTPTPGTMSTAMYYTGKDPVTKKEVYVPRTFREKKDQKNLLFAEEKVVDENG